jgi:hypothetical protein
VIAGVVVGVIAVAGIMVYSRAANLSSVEGARTSADVSALDAYAEELGLVMARSRGREPEAYARMADGPGPGVETLELADSDDGAVVVLRLRKERTERQWLTAGEPYEIRACYRWVFGHSMDDHRPERLPGCPDAAVIELGPAPVEPELPPGIDERLGDALAALARGAAVAEEDVAQAVRSAYADVERESLDDGADRAAILDGDVILAGDDWIVTMDGAIGVAIGRGFSCVMARIGEAGVDVWRPRRISLELGEIGCSAAMAANGGEW